MSKKHTPFTSKMLQQLGFIEYETDRFALPANLNEEQRARADQLAREKRKAAKVKPEQKIDTFIQLVKIEIGITLIPEYRFHETRMWRFDYAFLPAKIAIEVEGGIWIHGRHTRGKGYQSDMEKYNEAKILGWLPLQFQPSELMVNSTLDSLRRALDQRGFNIFRRD